MINLRYHIVSLTAVFLAIGIGLAFGSSFLDQATVDNLRGQLDGLRDRIESRDARISGLEDRLDLLQDEQAALDREGNALLRGLADGVPVVVVTTYGTDDAEVDRLVNALVKADAAVAGIWWLTDRFDLDDDGEIADLAEAIGVESTRPSILRREATALLTAAMRDWQALASPDAEEPTDTDGDDADTPVGDGAAIGDDDDVLVEGQLDTPGTAGAIQAMFARGFIDFQAIAGGPGEPHLPDGVRIVAVGGSRSISDDRLLLPLVDNLRQGPFGPSLVVATSVAEDDDEADEEAGDRSDLVATIRSDSGLRDQVSTVDRVDRFPGQAAIVLALVDLGSGVIGHYGTEDGATRLLPVFEGP